MFAVGTYNVLSSKLLSGYPETSDERDRQIVERITDEVTVVALQELDRATADEIEPMLAKKGYGLVYRSYKGDLFGLGVAYRLDAVRPVRVRTVRLADKKEWTPPPPPAFKLDADPANEAMVLYEAGKNVVSLDRKELETEMNAYAKSSIVNALASGVSLVSAAMGCDIGGFGSWLLPLAYAVLSYEQERNYHDSRSARDWILEALNAKSAFDAHPANAKAYAKARRSENLALAVEFEGVGASKEIPNFAFVSVHMPCMFWSPAAMVTFAGLLKKTANDFALASEKCVYLTPIPTIIAGDFNAEVGSPAYAYMTENTFDEAIFEEWADDWRPHHWQHPGEREDYRCVTRAVGPTTNTVSPVSGEHFTGQIDHIFVNEEATRRGRFPEVKVLGALTEILPNLEEPSDHLMVWARITL
jgi:endonuclease/exonuclease/phosphatase family metal-dependent hydrolase